MIPTWLLIRYDNIGYKAVKKAVQEYVFNLNVPTRVGFQTPFVNITMDVKVSPVLADEPVLIGGERQKETYEVFQDEMDLFYEVFLK